MRIFIVIPTFKEANKLRKILGCLETQANANVCTIVVNGARDVETSTVVKSFNGKLNVIELQGSADKYWSGLTNVGLSYVLAHGSDEDYVILANVDIEVGSTAVQDLVHTARECGRAQVGALAVYQQKIQSSGVRVRSWALCRNDHPLAGFREQDVHWDSLIEVDFLPTRFTAIPLDHIRRNGVANERLLPHYTADYELTQRLKRTGCRTLIYSGVRVECDMQHTGNSVYWNKMSLYQRISTTFSVKSEHNPIYRTLFIVLTYPWYAILPATMLYGAKSLMEIAFGGSLVRSIGFSQKE